MKKILPIIFYSILGSCFAQSGKVISAQEFNEEMAPIIAQLNKNNTVMKFKKETFSDVKASSPIESVNGVLYRGTGLSYKMMIGGITVLQTEELSIYIDSAQQFVQVTDIDSTMKALNMVSSFTPEMLANYDLEKSFNGSFTILKASPKIFDEGVMEFYIDPKNKRIYKLVISLPPANYFMEEETDETIESPYVTVIYEPITPLKKNEVSFSEATILNKDAKNKLSLTTAMAGYQLHDGRYGTKK